MICPNCGREIDNNSAFCPFCNTDVLNKGFINLNSLTDELIGLKKGVKSVITTAILSIILFGYLGLALAIWNLTKIHHVLRSSPLPQNVSRLDEYEGLKRKLTVAKVLSIVGIAISAIYIIIYPFIAEALQEWLLSLL